LSALLAPVARSELPVVVAKARLTCLEWFQKACLAGAMTDTLEQPTGTEHTAHPPFRASQQLADHLQQLLFLERLEQLAWMIDAENRIANRSIPRPIHE
jgi:hypothetical protein